jgi:hypothetical protein
MERDANRNAADPMIRPRYSTALLYHSRSLARDLIGGRQQRVYPAVRFLPPAGT